MHFELSCRKITLKVGLKVQINYIILSTHSSNLVICLEQEGEHTRMLVRENFETLILISLISIFKEIEGKQLLINYKVSVVMDQNKISIENKNDF